MKTWIICGGNTYTKEEMAREVLFGKAYPNDFVKSFEFDGVVYYKKRF
jgi:hypothetical protein